MRRHGVYASPKNVTVNLTPGAGNRCNGMPQHPAFAEGRTAVITGGASGIGLAAAKRFAALGMKICLADLSQEALDRAAEQLSAASVLTVPTDVSKMEEVPASKGTRLYRFRRGRSADEQRRYFAGWWPVGPL